MGALIVQHRVKDYRKWRRAYDAHAPARRTAGLGSAQVYRGADDPLKVAIFFKVKNESLRPVSGERRLPLTPAD